MKLAISERKIVCNACRARKKRCDGQRPTCSSCLNRQEHCIYVTRHVNLGGERTFQTPPSPPWQFNPSPLFPRSARDLAVDWTGRVVADGDIAIPPGPDLMPPLSTTFDDSWHLRGEQALSRPTPMSDSTMSDYSIGSSNNLIMPLDIPDDVSLPPQDELLDLADTYFSLVHPYLPIIHQASFRLSLFELDPLLLFAVSALAANEKHKESQLRWYKEAKRRYDLTSLMPEHPIETLQAAVCIVLQGMISCDHSSASLVLGRAWRQIVALGYHRLDRRVTTGVPGAPALPQDWIQRETIRRIVWMLFIMDRIMCFPVGLVYNIEEKHLNINLPMSDSLFQASSFEPATSPVIPFTQDFTKLMTSIRDSSRQTKQQNLFHYIILGTTLLGRIITCRFGEGSEDYDGPESRILEDDLFNFRMTLPRFVSNLSTTDHTDFGNAVWLNLLMDVDTILLQHGRGLHCDGSSITSGWANCVSAARHTVAIVRRAAHASVDHLINPHIAPLLFTCGRILAVEYLNPSQLTQYSSRASTPSSSSDMYSPSRYSPTSTPTKVDHTLKQDIDATMLVFDRLSEVYNPIGTKFKNGMNYYINRDPDSVYPVKHGGPRDLFTDCSSWALVQEPNFNLI
ncbi:fungal-specific transcription factor domain-containing protein, partial [Hypoxylon sp. FL0890]